MVRLLRSVACAAVALVSFSSAPEPAVTTVRAQSELVLHKDGTKLYHRPACPVVRDGRGVLALTRAQAESRGYKAHADCDPANAKAPDAAPRSEAAKPETVYVDGSRHYHRKTCSRLKPEQKSVKAMPLESAGKSHWPCPACKPPIRKRSTEPAAPGAGRRGG
jgi:hypothetical protein